LPLRGAIQAGLLTPDGREWLADRIVIPEMRGGRPLWMVGRWLPDGTGPESGEPKDLGLPGRKPLLGWEAAIPHREVCVVEGPFDWLTLRAWNVPALALIGTHVRPQALRGFRTFDRIFLLLDSDSAGRHATKTLQSEIGDRAVSIMLAGVKDV